MRRFQVYLALVTSLFVMSSEAFAVFDAQLLLGQRSGEVNDSDAKSQEVGVAVHVDPIPAVPVAFGLYANSISFEDSDNGYASGFSGLEAGVQVYAWFPIGIAGLKPYGKLGIPLYSAIKGDQDVSGTSSDLVMETSGMHINFGVGYSPLPLMAILFEVGLGQQKIKAKDIEVAGQTFSFDEEDYNTTAFLLGVEVGL